MPNILDWIAEIFKYPMQWFYNISGSYVVALILFALLVRIVFLPMSIYQQKLQIKGAKLRPRIAIIQKKYAGRDDPESRQQMQSEIMELQKKEGYSPFSGCLPLLLQMPVIMGIYQIIRKPLTFLMNIDSDMLSEIVKKIDAQAGAALEMDYEAINNLAQNNQIQLMDIIRNPAYAIDLSGIPNCPAATDMPDLTLFNGLFNLGETPWFTNLMILIPILTFVLAYLSMKITRKLNPSINAGPESADAMASTKIMDISMPLMSTVFTFTMPAAVGFYWLLGYIYSIIQTVILAKTMPMPTFTEEEIRQYEKEMKASKAISRQAAANQVRIRSRHHIDDEDYENALPPTSEKKEKAQKASERIDRAPKKKDKKN